MSNVTIKDLAAALSLSVSTVSRALSGDRNVSASTREKVLSAAEEMGYRKNPVAASLKAGNTRTVGVVVPEMWSGYTIQMIHGLQEVLYPLGVRVIIADSGEDPAREAENIRMMEGFMVDGLVVGLCSYLENKDLYKRLLSQKTPLAFFGRIPHGLEVSQVLVDDYAKSFFMVERMIRSGRRRIVHLEGPESIYNSLERCRGYRDALTKYGLDRDSSLIRRTGMSIEDGARAIDCLLEDKVSFDAIFSFTERPAVGAMNRLRELGLRIPEDIAVCSFSGTTYTDVVYPRMTTVEPPMYAIGETVAQLLMEKIKDPDSAPRTVVLNAEIKMQGSTGY